LACDDPRFFAWILPADFMTAASRLNTLEPT